jgi:predicted signal transduction protein with EAL and GGDEF domain
VQEFVEALLARLPAGKAFGPYTIELGDGRHLAVAVEPLADGGWVTTHQDITELRRSEATISYVAHHDALTGLPNRMLFGKRLEGALHQARPGAMVAQHLLDLDHFKNVNDSLGHAAGDKLLTIVTRGCAVYSEPVIRWRAWAAMNSRFCRSTSANLPMPLRWHVA